MSVSILLLATERGIWRCEYQPGAELCSEDFHVDAPGTLVRSISGRGGESIALCEDERLLVWDHAARMFREEELALSELDDVDLERCYFGPSGARYLGGCPPAILRSTPGGDWSPLGDLISVPEAGEWQGLESPYEPRVSALLEVGEFEGAGEAAPDLYAAISVGGLLRRREGSWESVAPTELPRDLRALAWAHDRLWIGGGQGLWWMTAEPFECRRASLPPSAGFVAQILALPGSGLLVAAAGGPPATWRGPDGSRMSLWHFADENGVGKPIAGPFHGVITGLAFDGHAALATTDDGELWRAPLEGPAPEEPLLADLPQVHGLFLADERPFPR